MCRCLPSDSPCSLQKPATVACARMHGPEPMHRQSMHVCRRPRAAHAGVPAPSPCEPQISALPQLAEAPACWPAQLMPAGQPAHNLTSFQAYTPAATSLSSLASQGLLKGGNEGLRLGPARLQTGAPTRKLHCRQVALTTGAGIGTGGRAWVAVLPTQPWAMLTKDVITGQWSTDSCACDHACICKQAGMCHICGECKCNLHMGAPPSQQAKTRPAACHQCRRKQRTILCMPCTAVPCATKALHSWEPSTEAGSEHPPCAAHP